LLLSVLECPAHVQAHAYVRVRALDQRVAFVATDVLPRARHLVEAFVGTAELAGRRPHVAIKKHAIGSLALCGAAGALTGAHAIFRFLIARDAPDHATPVIAEGGREGVVVRVAAYRRESEARTEADSPGESSVLASGAHEDEI
jgi:hypothetical protein